MPQRADGPPRRLKKRADFLRAGKGVRAHAASLTLQAAEASSASALPRLGFTTTKKLGGAVVRNRIRRRLRAAAASLPPVEWEAGHDYVALARAEALRREFPALVGDLAGALKRIKNERAKRRAPPRNDQV